MREIAVINPAAGGGKTVAIADNAANAKGARIYHTICEGDCRRYVEECCKEDPHTHFDIHGGDGSINEAVCGVMDAGAGNTATLTIVPSGSGNAIRSIMALAMSPMRSLVSFRRSSMVAGTPFAAAFCLIPSV